MSITCLKAYLIFFAVIKIAFWSLLYIRLLFYKKASSDKQEISFSTVICLKNDAEHLNNLETLADQAGLHELVLVDDFSNDQTKKEISRIYSKRIKKIHASIDKPGKKQALLDGIKVASCDNIVVTDIDCRPASSNWGFKMSNPLFNGYDLVLGYGPYYKKPGLLNKFIRFETLMTAIQYFSYALINIPYMGVGRNMAYKKELFKKHNGFQKFGHIASGDDDLFVQMVYKEAKIYAQLDPASFTYSVPKTTMISFFKQKQRHVTTASSYNFLHKICLGLFAFSHIMFYISIFICLLMEQKGFATMIYLLTIIPIWIIYMMISSKFKEGDLRIWFPFLDIIYFIYMVVLFPATLLKKKTW